MGNYQPEQVEIQPDSTAIYSPNMYTSRVHNKAWSGQPYFPAVFVDTYINPLSAYYISAFKPVKDKT